MMICKKKKQQQGMHWNQSKRECNECWIQGVKSVLSVLKSVPQTHLCGHAHMHFVSGAIVRW